MYDDDDDSMESSYKTLGLCLVSRVSCDGRMDGMKTDHDLILHTI